MKLKGKIAVKAEEKFNIPCQIVCGLPRVTVTGRQKVNIENHRGLLVCGDEEISVNSDGGIIRIRGTGMALSAMSRCELEATGNIVAVEYVM